jgi:hypothetical protein
MEIHFPVSDIAAAARGCTGSAVQWNIKKN